jgi:hypothetical protein
MPVPHKWKEIISAWAAGEVIQQRILSYDEETWGPWTVLKDGHAPIRTDMYIEYRVEPKDEPHKWQKEREAFLAGTRVEFRKRNSGSIGIHWHQVDSWLECDCRKTGLPIWDREHLEFRIVPESVVKQGWCYVTERGDVQVNGFSDKPNLKLTFVNGKLKEAEVLN